MECLVPVVVRLSFPEFVRSSRTTATAPTTPGWLNGRHVRAGARGERPARVPRHVMSDSFQRLPYVFIFYRGGRGCLMDSRLTLSKKMPKGWRLFFSFALSISFTPSAT